MAGGKKVRSTTRGARGAPPPPAPRLHGGRGDDTLAGGAGADYLEGGGGHDRYVFAAGDGVDVVDDTDGQGEIVLGDAVLDGDDAGVAYALDGDGTLSITAGAAGDAIRVQGFRDGMLGIHLGAAPATSAPSARDAATGVLKPLYTAPVDDSVLAAEHENGNEAGSGTLGAIASAHAGGTVAAARAAAIDSASRRGARARTHRYLRPGSPTTAHE
jgi:hypothetical protein